MKSPWLDPTEQEIMNQIAMQRQALGQKKSQLPQMVTSEAQMDLSPLAALADTWTGSNLSRNVQKPTTMEEQLATVAQLENALAKQEQGLTDQELEILKMRDREAQLAEDRAFRREMLDTRLGAAKDDKESKPVEIKDFQAQNAGFGKRIVQSEDVFSELEASGYNRASMKESAKEFFLPGEFQSENLKKQSQAERNFINSTLRRESGATITPEEFKNAEKQYLPRPGDTAEVLQQKKLNRQQVLESMKVGAGPAWDAMVQIPGTASKSNKPSFEEWKKMRGQK